MTEVGHRHHRVVVQRRGGPEVLQVVEEELPEPRAGEVRVRVALGPLRHGGGYAECICRPAGELVPVPRRSILPRPSGWWPTTSPRSWRCTRPPACTAASASWSTVRPVALGKLAGSAAADHESGLGDGKHAPEGQPAAQQRRRHPVAPAPGGPAVPAPARAAAPATAVPTTTPGASRP
jgi:hypothetical protein